MTSRRIWIPLLILLTLAAWMPLLGLIGSSSLAEALGCRLDESTTHPCRLFGVEIGPALYTAFVGGWLVLATWPLMLLTAAAWLALLLRAIVRRIGASRLPQ